MPDSTDNERLNQAMPWAQWPLGAASGPPPPTDYNTVWPDPKKAPDREQAAQGKPTTGQTTYVLGSSRDGSISPTTWNAPPARDTAQTDTYESWNPPLKKAVAISSSSVAGATVITTSANHLIPSTGGPFPVKITGHSGSTPDLNGLRVATYISATTFSIPVTTTVGGSGGTMALVCNSCTLNEEPRIYVTSSGSGVFTEKTFTRQKQLWIDGRFAVYGEVLEEIAEIAGSASASGGLP